jgi:hypothetical protein
MKTEKVKIDQTPDDLYREVINDYEKFRQDLDRLIFHIGSARDESGELDEFERFPFENMLFEIESNIEDVKRNLLISYIDFIDQANRKKEELKKYFNEGRKSFNDSYENRSLMREKRLENEREEVVRFYGENKDTFRHRYVSEMSSDEVLSKISSL